ncbi:hypothetical protein SFC55_26115 [Niallia taxi]|uniref:hypothetical protein n=1 Tax=Niallia taxi TaxID=2499688 RepID=UPI003982B3D4
MKDARLKISIDTEDQQTINLIKKEIIENLNTSNKAHYFRLVDEEDNSLTIFFSSNLFSIQDRMMKSFDEMVLEPMRQRDRERALQDVEQAN